MYSCTNKITTTFAMKTKGELQKTRSCSVTASWLSMVGIYLGLTSLLFGLAFVTARLIPVPSSIHLSAFLFVMYILIFVLFLRLVPVLIIVFRKLYRIRFYDFNPVMNNSGYGFFFNRPLDPCYTIIWHPERKCFKVTDPIDSPIDWSHIDNDILFSAVVM